MESYKNFWRRREPRREIIERKELLLCVFFWCALPSFSFSGKKRGRSRCLKIKSGVIFVVIVCSGSNRRMLVKVVICVFKSFVREVFNVKL